MDLNELVASLPCIVFSLQRAAGQVDFDRISGNGLAAVGIPANDSKAFAAAIHPDDLAHFSTPAGDDETRVIRLRETATGHWRPFFLRCCNHAGVLVAAGEQQSLVDDAQRYRDYAEMSSDWYWEQDAEFRFTYFSREFEEVTGVPSAQGLGKTRWGGLGKERLSDVDWEAHRQMLCSHQTFRNFEYPGRRTDGKIVWFRVSGKPRFDRDGRFAGYFGIASDVSASKQMEAHMHQSERLAAIGQLAAGMAHEINNPIGFVRSNLETLGKYLGDLMAVAETAAQAGLSASPDAAAALQRALTAADLEFVREDAPQLIDECRSGLERVRKIVADLREFAHEGDIDWAQADLHVCLDSAVNMLSSGVPENVSVEKIYAALPLLRCRPAQINQIALALLSNAILAIDAAGGTITIATGQDADSTLWFEIADTGCGIPSADMPRIFEPFFTTRPVGKGAGMGLATCFGIVSDHGGHIEVQSSPGAGSRFRVTLPLAGKTDRPA